MDFIGPLVTGCPLWRSSSRIINTRIQPSIHRPTGSPHASPYGSTRARDRFFLPPFKPPEWARYFGGIRAHHFFMVPLAWTPARRPPRVRSTPRTTPAESAGSGCFTSRLTFQEGFVWEYSGRYVRIFSVAVLRHIGGFEVCLYARFWDVT